MPASAVSGRELVKIPVDTAQRLCRAVLETAGAPQANADAQTRQLIAGDLAGRPSHGLQRLPTLIERIRNGVLDPAAEPAVSVRGAALDVDGRGGFGPVALWAAVEAAIPMARAYGVAVASVRNSGHIGMLAPYVESIARRHLIGLLLTTSEALVHPAGGSAALVGTNPIGIGVPADPEPFVLDMSTAAISAGEIMAHAERGEALPPGRAVAADGVPTTDPKAALVGAISPFGGFKGYALGLGFELLVAALTGTAMGRDVHGTLDVTEPATKGDVLIVASGDRDAADAAAITRYLDELRASPTAPGVERVLVPGDRLRAESHRRRSDGVVYPSETWQRLSQLPGASA